MTGNEDKKLKLYVFVKPIGKFDRGSADQPGIEVPDVLLRLAAAASTATVKIGVTDTAPIRHEKIRKRLLRLYRSVAPKGSPALKPMAMISCYDEKLKIWVPGPCVAVNAELGGRHAKLPQSRKGRWKLILSLKTQGD